MQVTTDTDWVPQVLYNMANAMFLPSLAQNASFGLIYAAGFLDITGIPAAASRLSYYTGGGERGVPWWAVWTSTSGRFTRVLNTTMLRVCTFRL